jgi:hypothetical protein
MTAPRGHRLAATIVGLTILGIPPAARATPPDMFSGSDTGTDPHFLRCDGFEVQLATTGTFAGTLYFDRTGQVIRVLVRNRAVDVLTNSVTGKTVTNRGVFQELFTRIEGTDDFTHSLVGYRFMATSPGDGVVLQDVGRIVYSPDEEQILQLAGQHHVPDGSEATAVFCAALS